MIRTPGDFVCFLHEKTLSTNQEPGSPQTHLPDLDLRLPIFACPVCMKHLVGKRRGPGLRGKGWKLGFPQYSQFMNVTLNHANILHNYIKLFIIV